MRALRFIFRNVDQYRTRFIVLAVVAFLDGAAQFFVPVLLADFTRGPLDFESFTRLIWYLAGLIVASLGLQWGIRRYAEPLQQEFGDHIRFKYFQTFERLPYERLIQRHSGYSLSLVNQVAGILQFVIPELFWTFARGLATLLLFFYFVSRESSWIGLLNFVLLIVFLTVSTLLSRRMVPLSHDLNHARATLIERYTDFMANLLTVKKLGIRGLAETTLRTATREADSRIRRVHDFHSNRWFTLHAIFYVTLLATIGTLLYGISRGTVAPSMLILFLSAYFMVQEKIDRLSENIVALIQAQTYIESLDPIRPPEEDLALTARGWELIAIEGVRFTYPNTARTILLPAFTLSRGERVCLIGPSGQGKTTLLHILAGFIEPQEGSVLVDGRTPREGVERFFATHAATISQEVELFNVSLRENLALGRNVPDAELLASLEDLDLGAWVAQLHEGLDTLVGEKGVRLSAGQKQRINLLRGMLLDRDVYFLDEPTSHLDAATEAKVVEFLRRRLAGKTAVVVSHRPAAESLCTRKYEMHEHELREIRA